MTEKPPAGWYPDSTGTTRWWDGNAWTDHQPPPPPPTTESHEEPMPEPVREAAVAAAAEDPTAQQSAPVRTRADAKAEKAYKKASRPWYKKKRWIGLIALLVIVGIVTATNSSDTGGPEKVGGSSSGSEEDSSSDSNKAGSKSNPFKVGDTVELEGTQYTVESAKKGPSVGGEFLKEEANGVYVIVELTIENKKDETKTFSDEAAKVIGGNGKTYSTDSDGTIAAIGSGEDTLIFADMQPDVPKTGTLVYDVPVGKAKGSMLEVSDLFGGGEAYIDLGL